MRRQLSESLAEATFFREAHERLRADYRALSMKKIHEFSAAPAINRQAKELLSLLGARLATENEEREHVKAAFSAKMYRAEQESCDWFVEKRLLQAMLRQQRNEIAEQKTLLRKTLKR